MEDRVRPGSVIHLGDKQDVRPAGLSPTPAVHPLNCRRQIYRLGDRACSRRTCLRYFVRPCSEVFMQRFKIQTPKLLRPCRRRKAGAIRPEHACTPQLTSCLNSEQPVGRNEGLHFTISNRYAVFVGAVEPEGRVIPLACWHRPARRPRWETPHATAREPAARCLRIPRKKTGDSTRRRPLFPRKDDRCARSDAA
jgi:hypothetical protein